jgi:hypothetical protein
MADEALSTFKDNVSVIREWEQLTVDDLLEFVRGWNIPKRLEFGDRPVATMGGVRVVVDHDRYVRAGLRMIWIRIHFLTPAARLALPRRQSADMRISVSRAKKKGNVT